MKMFLLVTAAFAVTSASSFNTPTTEAATTTRRAALDGMVTSTVAAALLLTASVGAPALAMAAQDISLPERADTAPVYSPFVGKTFTDPINHPNGIRTIEMTGTNFMGYRLATVKGGGGKGEPESYELPAMIFDCPGRTSVTGQYCISIDFTPKGGPKDFQGYWEEYGERKGIRFILDNNFWPIQ